MLTEVNYDVIGATRPADPDWGTPPPGYRAFERTVPVPAEFFEEALSWAIKNRSGFRVDPCPSGALKVGERYRLTSRLFRVREPVQIVAVVDEPDRRGFAYGTLPGHPVSGEEAFVVHRAADGSAWLTLRSLTRAPAGWWRLVFPGVLLVQPWYRGRYLSLGSAKTPRN